MALGTTSALPLSPKHASLVESPAQVIAGASKPWYFGAQSSSLTIGTFVPAQRVRVGARRRRPQPVTFAARARHGASQLGRETGTDWLDLGPGEPWPLSVRMAASWLKLAGS